MSEFFSQEKGITSLHFSAMGGSIKAAKLLIKYVEARDYLNRTPLIIAAQHCHEEMVKYLIFDVKCDPNVRNK